MVHGLESVASKSPFAMTEVGDGKLDADTMLVDAIVEEDDTVEEAGSEEKTVDEFTE